MTAYWNKRLHAELGARKITGQNKEYVIYGFTNGRTSSPKDLSDAEARELINSLPPPAEPPKEAAPKAAESPAAPKAAAKRKPYQHANPEAEPMRKRLIAMSYAKGKDVQFVKGWCEKQGVNGEKKKFNDYTVAELKKLSITFQKI